MFFIEQLEFALYNKKAKKHYKAALRMLSDYFDEIFADQPEENIPKKYLPNILGIVGDETKAYTIWMYLCFCGKTPVGFVMAQIDTQENPLCKREGWGFIREFYVAPAYRRKDCGRQMCRFIENVIYTDGAQEIYLTASAETATHFWEVMEYVFSGEIDESNGNRVYEKRRG